ncbi:MAG: type II secretion system protein, partial [Thermoanaerobaculia bacterium]
MFRTRISDGAAQLRSGQAHSGAAAPPRSAQDRAGGQEGFTLAGLIIIMTLISIFVAYTVPDQWSLVMNRERDRQTIWVMKQYARAIMTFHQKHKVLPTSLKQLHDARQPRVVRGEEELLCPLTGEADWILVPPQAVTVAGAPGAPGAVPGYDPNVPTTTIQE